MTEITPQSDVDHCLATAEYDSIVDYMGRAPI